MTQTTLLFLTSDIPDISRRDLYAPDSLDRIWIFQTKPMNCRFKTTIRTAIHVPQLQCVSGDGRANSDVQFPTPHPKIPVNDFRMVDTRVNYYSKHVGAGEERHSGISDYIICAVRQCPIIDVTENIAWSTTAHVSLSSNDAHGRVGHLLVSLASAIGEATRDGVQMRVFDEDLTEGVNVTPFTVSRYLRDWELAGILAK